MLDWKLIETRMVEQEGIAIEIVKKEWNGLLWVEINY